MSRKLDIIPVDKSQILWIQQAVNQSQLSGHWALLQDCHLNLECMKDLLYVLNTLLKSARNTNTTPHKIQRKLNDPRQVNESFRLKFTSEEHEDFPVSLLQIPVNYTCEVLSEDGLRTA
ncbi:unnamed protein product [Heterobilharzia americana]|nr:unnamed protein product [Heterobilharzia americana]CAH8639330.1 unnamed protein product [Heterobilharzia americana]